MVDRQSRSETLESIFTTRRPLCEAQSDAEPRDEEQLQQPRWRLLDDRSTTCVSEARFPASQTEQTAQSEKREQPLVDIGFHEARLGVIAAINLHRKCAAAVNNTVKLRPPSARHGRRRAKCLDDRKDQIPEFFCAKCTHACTCMQRMRENEETRKRVCSFWPYRR